VTKPTVCLITPPSVFLLDERVFPNLGILKVASALEARGYPVEHLDLDGVSNFEQAIEAHCEVSDARYVGITCTTPQLPAAARIARAIRHKLGQAGPQIIVGGPHPTVTLAAAKKGAGRAQKALDQLKREFDVVVAGDGEDAILQALGAPAGSVIDADDPKGPLFLTNKRLEETPWPARHLLDMGSYRYKIDGVQASTIIAQLGCPFRCTFCSGRSSPMLRRVRNRSTANVLAEIEHMYAAYGVQGFMFYDDELNVSKTMVELMRGIAALAKRLGTEFKLRGFVKAELFTQEQADVMYEAGFRWLLCGFESGSERILTNIEKQATVEHNDEACEFARHAGLKIKALMSAGHAGESVETIADTERWLLKIKPDDFDLTVITPYPGSPYFDASVETGPGIWTYSHPKTGDRLHMTELDYAETVDFYKGAPGEYRAYTWTDHLSAQDLVRLRDEVEARVRAALGIPYNAGAPGIAFEASMGQTKRLPPTILRASAAR
jgi:radical SAM superfamily enzyme YgiQ (UPF0313 family)